MIYDHTVHVKVSEYVWRNFSKFSNISKKLLYKKGVKYPFKVQFRSFNPLMPDMKQDTYTSNYFIKQLIISNIKIICFDFFEIRPRGEKNFWS